MILVQLGLYMQLSDLDVRCKHFTKFYSKWTIELNVKYKCTELLGENVCEIKFVDEFEIHFRHVIRKKNVKLKFIKIKYFCIV